MKKILFVNDTSKSKNIGCQITMEVINKALPHFSKKKVDRLPLSVINETKFLKKTKGLLPDKDTSFNQVVKNWRGIEFPNVKKIFEYVKKNDVIIINGEGSVISNKPHTKMIAMIIYIAKQVYTNKKVVLFNFTSDLGYEGKWLGRTVYPMCDYIFVREKQSLQEVSKLNSKVKFIPDIGLMLFDYDKIKKGKYVLLGGSSFFNKVSFTKSQDLACQTYQKIINQYPDIQFVGGSWHKDEWLSKLAGSNYTYVKVRDYKHYAYLLKNAICNITGRHHGIVLSACLNIPFLAFEANCYKTLGDVKSYIYNRKIQSTVFSYTNFYDKQFFMKMNNIFKHELLYKETLLKNKEVNKILFDTLEKAILDVLKT